MREKRQRAQGSPIRALFPVLAFALVLLLAVTAEAWVSTLAGWALAAGALGLMALAALPDRDNRRRAKDAEGI